MFMAGPTKLMDVKVPCIQQGGCKLPMLLSCLLTRENGCCVLSLPVGMHPVM